MLWWEKTRLLKMATPKAMMAFGGSGADRDDEVGEGGMIVY